MTEYQLKYKKILVLSDNKEIAEGFVKIINTLEIPPNIFTFRTSQNPFNIANINIETLILKNNIEKIILEFDLLLSLHCLQIIPEDIVKSVKCINIHPGFNPYNRGWYPQVFSIINGLPAGATIHEMDEQIDNGPLIAQKQVAVEPCDTSLSLYEKIKDVEFELLEQNIKSILSGNYITSSISGGNINTKNDFKNLCFIDTDEITTFGKAINKLRALSHGDFKNAYFVDEETGKKIFVKIQLSVE